MKAPNDGSTGYICPTGMFPQQYSAMCNREDLFSFNVLFCLYFSDGILSKSCKNAYRSIP